mmetsp:Transcript_5081/g.7769  ORF Transcript_5081/g.7769 Transcript_5081/m.7769 type:complete len:734 (+) Transcript_5081:104-2305(+)
MAAMNWPDAALDRGKCKDFILNYRDGQSRKYYNQLQQIADREILCLNIMLDDVMDYANDAEFVGNIENNASRYLRHFEEVADELMPASIGVEEDVFDVLHNQRVALVGGGQREGEQPIVPDIPRSLTRRFEVTITPRQSEKAKKLREIKAHDIGHLVSVKGMVTRTSDVKPQVSVVTYTCDICGSEIYQEISGSQFMPLTKCPSQRCQDNNAAGRLQMQTRGSRFVKYQEIRLQELPDQVPVGHIPRSLTVHCRGERTRKCGPGDVVTVAGIFLTTRYSGFRAIKAGLQADTFVEAMGVFKHKLGYEDVLQQGESESGDIQIEISEVANDPDPYSRLAGSIAPEIFGHEDVKKALLLQLVGGATRVLSDGMKIRGDINICLMGDPGVAKSQLLKYIASIAPRGVYTTGKGSSGVGLTAAVVRDNLTGDLALEGGALVLADKGICCIDEFDKMQEADRTAIHEVMEQQTISIAKAGITTTLNARAAVLAAANPVQGRYNRRKSVSDNVALPNSLLSRFDLLFLILDKVDLSSDLALSRHVLHVHKYLQTPTLDFTPLEPSTIKHYVAAARNINPVVPVELTSYIVEAYVSMRLQDHSAPTGRAKITSGSDQTVMTARLLLSILRLSQALARLRLSDTVSHEDVDEAIRLTHASKASLHDDVASMPHEDTISAIFSVLRDFAGQHNLDVMNFAQAEAMIIKKGFTATQLESCLQEYQGLGVIHVDEDRTHISFDG